MKSWKQGYKYGKAAMLAVTLSRSGMENLNRQLSTQHQVRSLQSTASQGRDQHQDSLSSPCEVDVLGKLDLS